MMRIASTLIVTALLASSAGAESRELTGEILIIGEHRPAPFRVATRTRPLLPAMPEGAAEAPEAVLEARYCVHEIAGRPVTMVVGRETEESSGPDVLWIDADADGSFGKGERHAIKPWTRHRGATRVVGGSVRGVALVIGDQAYALDLQFTYVRGIVPQIRVSGLWFLESRVTVGEVEFRLCVRDGDLDGRFDGARDHWVVIDDRGVEKPRRWYEIHAVGEGQFLAGHRFRVQVTARTIALTVDAADGPAEEDLARVRRRVAQTWAERQKASREEFVKTAAIDSSRARATRAMPWRHLSFEDAQDLAKSEGKPLFVDVRAFWSGDCYLLDIYTYADAEVARLLSNRFILVRIIQEQDPGGDYRRLAKMLGGGRSPAQGVWSPDGEHLHTIRGWRRPQDMVRELDEAFSKLRAAGEPSDGD